MSTAKRGVLLLLFLLFLPVAFAQTVTTIYPIVNSNMYVFEGTPDTSYSTGFLYVGNNREGKESVTFARFNTSPYTSITRADLTITNGTSSSSDTSLLIKIYALTSDWDARTTWSNMPNLNNMPSMGPFNLKSNEPLTIDVTPLLSQSQNLRYGIAVRAVKERGRENIYNLKDIALSLSIQAVKGTSGQPQQETGAKQRAAGAGALAAATEVEVWRNNISSCSNITSVTGISGAVECHGLDDDASCTKCKAFAKGKGFTNVPCEVDAFLAHGLAGFAPYFHSGTRFGVEPKCNTDGSYQPADRAVNADFFYKGCVCRPKTVTEPPAPSNPVVIEPITQPPIIVHNPTLISSATYPVNAIPGQAATVAYEGITVEIGLDTTQRGTITFSKYEGNPTGKIPIDRQMVGNVIGISTTLNNVEAEIRFPYTNDELGDDVIESSLRLAHFNEDTQEWEPLEGGVNIADRYVYARTDHFSDFVRTGDSCKRNGYRSICESKPDCNWNSGGSVCLAGAVDQNCRVGTCSLCNAPGNCWVSGNRNECAWKDKERKCVPSLAGNTAPETPVWVKDGHNFFIAAATHLKVGGPIFRSDYKTAADAYCNERPKGYVSTNFNVASFPDLTNYPDTVLLPSTEKCNNCFEYFTRIECALPPGDTACDEEKDIGNKMCDTVKGGEFEGYPGWSECTNAPGGDYIWGGVVKCEEGQICINGDCKSSTEPAAEGIELAARDLCYSYNPLGCADSGTSWSSVGALRELRFYYKNYAGDYSSAKEGEVKIVQNDRSEECYGKFDVANRLFSDVTIYNLGTGAGICRSERICTPPSAGSYIVYPKDQWAREWCRYYNSEFKDRQSVSIFDAREVALLFNNDWGTRKPAEGLDSADHIGFKSNRKICFPETAAYNFYVYADDRAIVFVDGQQLLDTRTNNQFRKTMLAGECHDFEIDYYDEFGSASISFFYNKEGERPPEPVVIHSLSVFEGNLVKNIEIKQSASTPNLNDVHLIDVELKRDAFRSQGCNRVGCYEDLIEDDIELRFIPRYPNPDVQFGSWAVELKTAGGNWRGWRDSDGNGIGDYTLFSKSADSLSTIPNCYDSNIPYNPNAFYSFYCLNKWLSDEGDGVYDIELSYPHRLWSQGRYWDVTPMPVYNVRIATIDLAVPVKIQTETSAARSTLNAIVDFIVFWN